MLRRNSSFVKFARPFYRRLRTEYLKRRYPRGHFIDATGVPVFCDFFDPSYVWYDADSDYLQFHKSVLEALIRQSTGNVFVDVGAHFGFYAAFIAAAVRREDRPAVIIAVEPDRHHFACLARTAERFDGNGVRADLVAAAVSDRNGVLSLYKTEASCLHSYAEGAGAVGCYDVPATTLDTLIETRLSPSDRVAMIKVDVDGAEPFVIDGWRETMKRYAPIVLTEFSPAAVSAAGRDPRALFFQLCDEFSVSHVDHHHTRVHRVGRDDYEGLAALVGGGVTDLVLTAAPLTLPGVSSGPDG